VSGAEWVRWVFAAVFAALTVFYLARLCTPHQDASAWEGTAHRGVDASRGVMGLGMVAMLVPWVDPLPRLYWQVIFGLAAGHIAVRLIRRQARSLPVPSPDAGGHHELHLVVGGLAMVYMLAGMPAEHSMAEGVEMAAMGSHGMGSTGMGSTGMGSTGMGSTGTALPVLTWAFIAYFLVFVVRLGTRLTIPSTTGSPNTGATNTGATDALAIAALGSRTRDVVISPHLLGSSELVMAIGMSYMLLTML
jgi:3D (Asp-Asp-Asp) domain-containing protein